MGAVWLAAGCRSVEQTAPAPSLAEAPAPATQVGWTFTVETVAYAKEGEELGLEVRRVRKHWVMGQRFRVEEEPGGRVLLGADGEFYEYDPKSMVGRELMANPLPLPFLQDPASTRKWLEAQGYRSVKEETVSDRLCLRYQAATQQEDEQITFWLDSKTRLPVASEYRTGNVVARSEYRDFVPHKRLDDELFQLPPEVKIVTKTTSA